MHKHTYSYLALGDSYTICEGVPLHDSFPYQVVQMLRAKGHHFHAPEIIAQTGWTTFELAEKLLRTNLNPLYDFVTLLIGVNNQYRGLLLNDYKSDFEFLVKKALHFTGEKKERVIVLSIPDWGVTPFAQHRDPQKIAKEIDLFNSNNKAIAEQYHTAYIEITSQSRETLKDPAMLTADKLHPGAEEYKRWATLVADEMEKHQ